MNSRPDFLREIPPTERRIMRVEEKLGDLQCVLLIIALVLVIGFYSTYSVLNASLLGLPELVRKFANETTPDSG